MRLIVVNNRLPEDLFVFAVAGCQRYTILLVGDSLIHWVADHASRTGKPGLGLSASVMWEGRRGLYLSQLVDYVLQVLSPVPPVPHPSARGDE